MILLILTSMRFRWAGHDQKRRRNANLPGTCGKCAMPRPFTRRAERNAFQTKVEPKIILRPGTLVKGEEVQGKRYASCAKSHDPNDEHTEWGMRSMQTIPIPIPGVAKRIRRLYQVSGKVRTKASKYKDW